MKKVRPLRLGEHRVHTKPSLRVTPVLFKLSLDCVGGFVYNREDAEHPANGVEALWGI